MRAAPAPLGAPPEFYVMPIRTLIIVVLAAAVIAGCGRRGPLEAPDAAAVEVPAPAAGALDAPAPAAPPPEPEPQRRFFLDFLL